MRQKATARPALRSVAAEPVSPAADIPATFESLGRQLRDALPARRLHSVSLCDHDANVLWLSEGALGPDEHNLITEALERLAADTSLPCHETGLEDGRLALFLPVRTPTAQLVGIAMILADGKTLSDDTLERMGAPPVRAILRRLAVMMKPPASPPRANAPAQEAADRPGFGTQAQPDARELSPLEAAAAAAAAAAAGHISPQEVDEILEIELTAENLVPVPLAPAKPAAARTSDTSSMMRLEFLADRPPAQPEPRALSALEAAAAAAAQAAAPAHAAPPAHPTAPAHATAPAATAHPASTARAAAPARVPAAAHATPPAPPAPAAVAAPAAGAASGAAEANVQLEVVPFAKLRAGGQNRRFQVLARLSPPLRDPAAQDALVLQHLMSWLATHRVVWSSQLTGFTVNLSIATLEDERFGSRLAAALNSHGIAAETLGFEIAEALCTQRRAQVERFIAQCEKAGCWIAIDDFSFDSQVLPLLRSKALRLLKIDAKLTSLALKDKFCQAMVVAIVQAAKVLGIHCAAKQVDSQAALQWLGAIGCDFAQGPALAAPRALDALVRLPDTTGLTAHLRSS